MGYKSKRKKKSNPSKMQKFKNLKKKRKEAFKQPSKKILKKPPNAPDAEKREPKVSYAHDSSLTCYDGIWVKQEAVASLQSLKADLTRRNVSNKKVKLIMMKAKRKANRAVQSEQKVRTTKDKTEKNAEEKTEDKEGDVVME